VISVKSAHPAPCRGSWSRPFEAGELRNGGYRRQRCRPSDRFEEEVVVAVDLEVPDAVEKAVESKVEGGLAAT
jgi:hypothetical protein